MEGRAFLGDQDFLERRENKAPGAKWERTDQKGNGAKPETQEDPVKMGLASPDLQEVLGRKVNQVYQDSWVFLDQKVHLAL